MPASVILQEREKGTVFLCPLGRWLSLGRSSKSNDIACKNKHVSRNHCRLQAQEDGRLLVQDRSSFGTAVNGERVYGLAYAERGDVITLGTAFELVVHGVLDPDVTRSAQAEPAPPCRLGGRYILLREVGRGGMGVVFEAWDERERRRVALKWLIGGGRADEDAMRRFQREALLQGRLIDYPGIVKLHDLVADFGSGELFCVMEFVDGDSLLKLLRDEIPVERAVRIIARVARAVDYAHRQGVVHRDIKPANVLVTRDGQVRLTDFGIARGLDPEGARTMTGIMLGTPGYMAPEQIVDAKRAGPTADVYALGALVYTALTGKLPLEGRTMRDALNDIARGVGPPPPSARRPGVDPALEALCMRALAFDPARRFPTAGDFAQQLEGWLAEREPAAPPVSLAAPGPAGTPPAQAQGEVLAAAPAYPPTRKLPPVV